MSLKKHAVKLISSLMLAALVVSLSTFASAAEDSSTDVTGGETVALTD